MKKVFLLLILAGSLNTLYGQTHQTQWLFTPTVGVGYKVSDWLYGAPFCLGGQAQVLVKNNLLLEVPVYWTSFKDVIFKDQKFHKLFSSEQIRHTTKVVGFGAGYHVQLVHKSYLQVSGGAVFVRYTEPYVSGPSGGIILSSYDVDYYSHNSTGLYAKIQYHLFLRDKLRLAIGTTALSCRYLSYGTFTIGLSFGGYY